MRKVIEEKDARTLEEEDIRTIIDILQSVGGAVLTLLATDLIIRLFRL